MNRKNTRYIERDMPKLVGSMVNRLCNQWLNQAARLDAYADTELSSEQAHDLTMLSFRDGCIPGSQLQRVVDCWDTPTHDEFEPRNAWSLFNCFTEAQKKTPSMIPERSIALNNTFSGYCKEAIDRILDDRQLDTDISDIEDAEIIV
jgi:hypothetical protein